MAFRCENFVHAEFSLRLLEEFTDWSGADAPINQLPSGGNAHK